MALEKGPKRQIAILASGSGSTAEPVFDYACVVITNNPDAGIIERVESYNQKNGTDLAFEIRSRKNFYVLDPKTGEVDKKASRLNYGEELLKILHQYGAKYVFQLGWAILTPGNVIDTYKNYIVNSHPAPLDPKTHIDFGGPGMHGLAPHEAVIQFYKRVSPQRDFQTAVTLHKATEEYDKGEMLMYTPVPIKPNDTAETLQARVKEVERKQNRNYAQEVIDAGRLVKLFNSHRVILPGEEKFLEEAKRIALEKYPKG